MHSLPLFLKLAGRPVILLGIGAAAEAKRRILERAGADICTDEAAPAALAIVAIEDEEQAQAVVARLKARGVLVNAVDRPAVCDFTLPAIVDRDPVLIAIGTGGASAGLAKALRQRLEALVSQSLGRRALALGAARADMRARWPDPASRRHAIDAALAEGAALDVLADTADTDDAAVAHWLAGAGEAQGGSRLEHIRIVSDNPDDLTLRAARLLGQADAVFHASDIAPAILVRARADALRQACDTAPSWAGPGLALWIEKRNEA
jgi:uroporphyrin-III C-methyltransferase / precorrin-2 dehydrogenase / sirohydrochlorin ferrochelatase